MMWLWWIIFTKCFGGIQKGRLLRSGGVPRKRTGGGGVKLVYAFSLWKNCLIFQTRKRILSDKLLGRCYMFFLMFCVFVWTCKYFYCHWIFNCVINIDHWSVMLSLQKTNYFLFFHSPIGTFWMPLSTSFSLKEGRVC